MTHTKCTVWCKSIKFTIQIYIHWCHSRRRWFCPNFILILPKSNQFCQKSVCFGMPLQPQLLRHCLLLSMLLELYWF